MEYNPFDSDDEEFGFVTRKLEDGFKSDDDYNDNTVSQTNPFLIEPTCMGREVSTNLESQDDFLTDAKNTPFLQDEDDDDDYDDGNVNITAGFLNNNPFFQIQRSCGRGIPANFSQSDIQTQQRMIEAYKTEFIHNDLKEVHGVNEKFIAETEITELLRNCNIYCCSKSRLNSKNTLRVPNVLFNVNLNRKVPLIIDDQYFKFDATPPTINEIFEAEYLEEKYKLRLQQAEQKSFTPKDIYFLKRDKRCGTNVH